MPIPAAASDDGPAPEPPADDIWEAAPLQPPWPCWRGSTQSQTLKIVCGGLLPSSHPRGGSGKSLARSKEEGEGATTLPHVG